MSLRDALATLGFGPCYHPADAAAHGDLIADLATLRPGRRLATVRTLPGAFIALLTGNSRIGKGTSEDFDTLLRGYGCVLDYPAAMYHAELHAYYPDAKFIPVRAPLLGCYWCVQYRGRARAIRRNGKGA